MSMNGGSKRQCGQTLTPGRCLGPVKMLSDSIAIPCEFHALETPFMRTAIGGEQYHQHYAPVNQSLPVTLNNSQSYVLTADGGATWQPSSSLSKKPAADGGAVAMVAISPLNLKKKLWGFETLQK